MLLYHNDDTNGRKREEGRRNLPLQKPLPPQQNHYRENTISYFKIQQASLLCPVITRGFSDMLQQATTGKNNSVLIGKDEVGGSNPPSSSFFIPETVWFWDFFFFLLFFCTFLRLSLSFGKTVCPHPFH